MPKKFATEIVVVYTAEDFKRMEELSTLLGERELNYVRYHQVTTIIPNAHDHPGPHLHEVVGKMTKVYSAESIETLSEALLMYNKMVECNTLGTAAGERFDLLSDVRLRVCFNH